MVKLEENILDWPKGLIDVTTALAMYHSEKTEPVIPHRLRAYMKTKTSLDGTQVFDKVIAERLVVEYLSKLAKNGYAKKVAKENSTKFSFEPTAKTKEIYNYIQRITGDSWKNVKWNFNLAEIKNGPVKKQKFFRLKINFSYSRIIKSEDLEFVCVRKTEDQDNIIGKVEFVWYISRAAEVNRLDRNYFDVRKVMVDNKTCREVSYKENGNVHIRYIIPKFEEIKDRYANISYEIFTVSPRIIPRLYTMLPQKTHNYSATLDYSKTKIKDVTVYPYSDKKMTEIKNDIKNRKISVNVNGLLYAQSGTFFGWTEGGITNES